MIVTSGNSIISAKIKRAADDNYGLLLPIPTWITAIDTSPSLLINDQPQVSWQLSERYHHTIEILKQL